MVTMWGAVLRALFFLQGPVLRLALNAVAYPAGTVGGRLVLSCRRGLREGGGWLVLLCSLP